MLKAFKMNLYGLCFYGDNYSIKLTSFNYSL